MLHYIRCLIPSLAGGSLHAIVETEGVRVVHFLLDVLRYLYPEVFADYIFADLSLEGEDGIQRRFILVNKGDKLLFV